MLRISNQSNWFCDILTATMYKDLIIRIVCEWCIIFKFAQCIIFKFISITLVYISVNQKTHIQTNCVLFYLVAQVLLQFHYQTVVWSYYYLSEWKTVWMFHFTFMRNALFYHSLCAQFISDSETSLSWETARRHWYRSRWATGEFLFVLAL